MPSRPCTPRVQTRSRLLHPAPRFLSRSRSKPGIGGTLRIHGGSRRTPLEGGREGGRVGRLRRGEGCGAAGTGRRAQARGRLRLGLGLGRREARRAVREGARARRLQCAWTHPAAAFARPTSAWRGGTHALIPRGVASEGRLGPRAAEEGGRVGRAGSSGRLVVARSSRPFTRGRGVCFCAQDSIKVLRNHIKIGDWAAVEDDFAKVNKLLEKSREMSVSVRCVARRSRARPGPRHGRGRGPWSLWGKETQGCTRLRGSLAPKSQCGSLVLRLPRRRRTRRGCTFGCSRTSTRRSGRRPRTRRSSRRRTRSATTACA